jgi:hypothetical protein
LEENDMNRFANLFLLELAFLLSPLGGLAQVAPAGPGTITDRGNAPTGLEIARPVRLTVAPQAHTPVVIATLPKATCALHLEGDTTRSVKLFADWEGMVRFYVRPAEESDLAVPFVLDRASIATTWSSSTCGNFLVEAHGCHHRLALCEPPEFTA